MTDVRLSYLGGGVAGTLLRMGDEEGAGTGTDAGWNCCGDSCWSLPLRERACWLAVRAMTAAEGRTKRNSESAGGGAYGRSK